MELLILCVEGLGDHGMHSKNMPILNTLLF